MSGFFGQATHQMVSSSNIGDQQAAISPFLPATATNHLFHTPTSYYSTPHIAPAQVEDQAMMQLHPHLEQVIRIRLENHTHQWQQRTEKAIQQVLQPLLQRIAKLEAQLEHQQTRETSSEDENKPPKEVQTIIIEAIQEQAKTLLGISEIREKDNETGRVLPKKLILPLPYTAPGYQPRQSDGHELFSPDWPAGKNEAYNRRYLNAVTTSVLERAKENSINIPEEYRTFDIFRRAAEQYFSTLASKYMAQINPDHAQKLARKADGNKVVGRKHTKCARRIAAWPAFKKKHNIEQDLTYLIDIGYMSPEDDGPGNISAESWEAEAKKVTGAGQTVFETQRLPWRTEKLIRFYYALDHESFNPSDPLGKRAKLSHVRFHGFKQNESQAVPYHHARRGQLVPFYIVDLKWLQKAEYQDFPLDQSAEPDAWRELVIADDELDPRDLQAIQKWSAEQENRLEEEE